MNGFSRAASALMAVCILLLGSAGAAEARPFSLYKQYNSHLFVNGNLKLFFQRQWRANTLRMQGKDAVVEAAEGRSAGESPYPASATVETPVTQVRLPLSVSSFRTVSGPIMPKRLAAGVPDLDETQRQELEGAFQELLKGYDHLLDENDEPRLKNNLAGAFNFLFASSYYALKNGQELSEEQQESMLEQLNTGIAMGLKERRMSDRDKQELYEGVVLSGTLILGLYNEGRDKGRPEQQQTARELARDLLEQMMGITIDKVQVNGNSVRIELARG